jgi:hypothetical protein
LFSVRMGHLVFWHSLVVKAKPPWSQGGHGLVLWRLGVPVEVPALEKLRKKGEKPTARP